MTDASGNNSSNTVGSFDKVNTRVRYSDLAVQDALTVNGKACYGRPRQVCRGTLHRCTGLVRQNRYHGNGSAH
jgi:hypothetical protein